MAERKQNGRTRKTDLSRVFMADFETRAGDEAEAERKTWVWAWAITSLADFETVKTGNTIDSFIAYITSVKFSQKKQTVIYFHNLKFDGKFIIDYLLKAGYEWTDEKKLQNGQFKTLIDGTGVFYSITMKRQGNGEAAEIEIRDSSKKIPGTVARIGKDFNTKYQKTSIDYKEDRPADYEMTPEETEYIKNDVRVVAEALKHIYETGNTKMTIGSDCIQDFQNKMGGKDAFRRFFPILSDEEIAHARAAYRGGYCYVNKPGHFTNVKGATYDVNSLYPSMMHSTSGNYYPVGAGEWYDGHYTTDEYRPLYIEHIKASFILKEKHLPTLMKKGIVTGGKIDYLKNEYEPIDLYLTNVDYDLFKQHYDILSEENIGGYKYQAVIGIFDSYIDAWSAIKKESKGAQRQLAKLMLNNLYGKFAQRTIGRNKRPALDRETGIVHYLIDKEDEREPLFPPVGCFVTSYSRRFTITAAQKNFDIFCYADTDSIHVLGAPEGITIHPKNLNCWAHESDWDEAIFLRQKTYMEHTTAKDETPCTPEWDIKCAGMDKVSKQHFLDGIASGEYTPDDFKIGLLIDGFKLKPVTVCGGVILYPTKFQIKP